MRKEEKAERKKAKFRWFIPLLATGLSLVWERLSFGKNKVIPAKLIFGFFGVFIFYNWIMGWVKDRPGEKPPKIEVFLAFPTLLFIVIAMMLPFPYVRGWLFTGLFMMAGYLFWVFAIGVLRQEKGVREVCTARAAAVVIDNVEDRVSHKPGEISPPTYYPVLSYYAEGEQREQRLPNGQPRPMECGKEIEIFYNPQEPEEFCFAEKETDRAVSLIVPLFMIIGSVLLILAVLSWFLKWRF